MKTSYFLRSTTIALTGTLLMACGELPKSNSEASDRSRTTGEKASNTANVTGADRHPAATHCRISHEYTYDGNNNVVTTRIVRYLRTAGVADFASRPDTIFHVSKSYFNETVTGVPFRIDIADRFSNTVDMTNNSISVDFRNAAFQKQSDFTAALTMKKFDTEDLWAEGDAPPMNGAATGKIVMFMLPDDSCRHPAVVGKCRIALVEYFHPKDTDAKKDYPQISGTGQNIFLKADCPDVGTAHETSDGEGHEGPP